jgi:hypothetical protein
MRVRVLAGTILAAAIGVTGLAGCAGNGGDLAGTPAGSVVEEYSDEAADGLEALGFDTDLVAYAAIAPSASPTTPGPKGDRREKRRERVEGLRHRFGKRALHGEFVVQTKDGVKTLVVQRGTVTAITDTSITVKSADGFTLTWTFGDKLRVVERRTTVQPKDVAVGTEVGVSGAKEGDQPVARFIVIPVKKPVATPTK